MKKWWLVLLCVSACVRSKGAVSRPGECAAPGVVASTKPASVSKLAVGSSDVVFHRESGMVGGYLDIQVEDIPPQRSFMVLNPNDNVVFRRQALLSDAAQIAALERDVNEYLSYGGWEVMESGRPATAMKGMRTWKVLDWTVAEDHYGALQRIDEEGELKSFTPYGQLPYRALCPNIQVEVASLAMHAATRRVFVTYRRTQGKDCQHVNYAHTFVLWTGWDFLKAADAQGR